MENGDIRNLNKVMQEKALEMKLGKQPMPRPQVNSGICFSIDMPRSEALARLSKEACISIQEP
jgi:hypothetical protein